MSEIDLSWRSFPPYRIKWRKISINRSSIMCRQLLKFTMSRESLSDTEHLSAPLIHPALCCEYLRATWQQEVSIIKETEAETWQHCPDSGEGPVPAWQDTLCHLTPAMSCQLQFVWCFHLQWRYEHWQPFDKCDRSTSLWGEMRERERAKDGKISPGITHLAFLLYWCTDMQTLISSKSMMWRLSSRCC